MSNLFEVLTKIKQDKNISTYNEEQIKTSIILNILYCLNWDIFTRDEVYPEYVLSNGRVDYALRINSINKLFIEAKSGRISFNDIENDTTIDQLLKYCYSEGVELAIITNGIIWWFYLPLSKGKFYKRKFYTIDIITQDIHDIIDNFNNFLSKENIKNGTAIKLAYENLETKKRLDEINESIPKAYEKILNEQNDNLFFELLAEETEKLCGYKPTFDQVKNFISSIKLPTEIPQKTAQDIKNGSEKSDNGKYWFSFKTNNKIFRNTASDIYVEILNQFISEDIKFAEKFGNLLSRNRKRRYIAERKEDLYIGRPDLANCSKKLNNGWYVGTNYSRQSILNNIKIACEIMEVKLGIDLIINLGL